MKKTRISVISGHLTATNKKTIKYMFENDMMEGSTPKIQYFITDNTDGTFTVKIKSFYNNTIGGNPKWHTSTSKFKFV